METKNTLSKRKISVVIRVRNAAEDLRTCLSKIRDQVISADCEIEIVVVDNESKDGSADVAKEFGGRVVPLAISEFSWGRALNRGISKASGELIVILSVDAYPANSRWLVEMIRPFENIRIAAVYGRQLPRDNAPVDEVVRLRNTFPKASYVVNSLPRDFSPRGGGLSVSNACSAIRRAIWETMPYDESIRGGEERIWTYNALSRGYSVAYQASARVYHSHDDSIFRSSWRHLQLIKKDAVLSGENVNIFTYIHFILIKVKRRIQNTCFPGLRTTCRIKGLLVLPFEIVLFFLVAFFFHIDKGRARYRPFSWDN